MQMQKGPFQVNWHASGSELGTHPDPLRPNRGRTNAVIEPKPQHDRGESQKRIHQLHGMGVSMRTRAIYKEITVWTTVAILEGAQDLGSSGRAAIGGNRVDSGRMGKADVFVTRTLLCILMGETRK